MKNLIKTGSKILASLMLMALVMLNFQIGVDGDVESSALESMGLTTTVNTMEAQAAWCDPTDKYCTFDVFGNLIWGEYRIGRPPTELEEN